MAKSAFSRSKQEGDPEVKPAVAVNVITIKQDLLSQLEGRIPSWEKMKKNVAHILKLKAQLLQKMESTALIDVELLQEANDRILKLVQVNTLKMNWVS